MKHGGYELQYLYYSDLRYVPLARLIAIACVSEKFSAMSDFRAG